MPEYGVCVKCKEPSILGYLSCLDLWICPYCAAPFLKLSPSQVEDIKQSLKRKYAEGHREKKEDYLTE